MNLLTIFDFYPPHVGGAEVVYKHVCEGLVQRGHEVSLVTLRENGEWRMANGEWRIENGVRVRRVIAPARMLFPFWGFVAAWREARKADVILTSLYSSSILTLMLKVLLGKKAMIIVHEYLGHRWFHLGFSFPRALFLAFCEWLALLPWYDGYICVSESTKKHLHKKIPREKLHVIYNGVESELFYPRERNDVLRKKLGIPQGKSLFLYAGRPGYAKGLTTLLEAISILKHSSNDFHLALILSKRPMEKYREALSFITKHGLEGYVTIFDSVPREELPEYFAMANIGVVPSITEGFGFTAAEFAAMNIPLVVSEVDSLPEIIGGKVSFAKPGNVQSLCKAMERALKGEFQKLPPRRFAWEAAVEKYDTLIKNI